MWEVGFSPVYTCSPVGRDHYRSARKQTVATDMSGSRRRRALTIPKRVLLLKLIHHTLKQIPGVGELESFSVD